MPSIVAPFVQRGMRPLFRVALCSQLIWPMLAFAYTPYDEMVLDARAGHYTPALTALRQVPPGQATTSQISDHLQIASWAGLDAEVIKVYETQGRNLDLPVAALTATARAYRNQKRWDDANRVYSKAQAIEPDNQEVQLGMALNQADSDKPDQAVTRARALVAAQPNDVSRRMALGYALNRAGKQYDSLFEYDQAFVRSGNDPQVAREYVGAMQRAHLPEPALRLARQRPGLIDPVTIRRLEGDLAAERVRLSEMPTRSESERYVIADRALADYDQLISTWSSDPQAKDDVIRWRIDRMGALKARSRTAEVISEHHKLQAEGVEVPVYAQRWVAASYLDQREPEIATDMYREILLEPDADPSNRLLDTTALYYALLESGEAAEARTVAEELAKTQRPRVELKGLPGGNPNDEWMDAQQLAAQAGTYSSDLPHGEERLQALVEQAPGNVSLRVAQADLYLARGWPRLAESKLKEAESMAPRDINLEIAQAHTATDLQEWRQMDALTDDVVARSPDNRQVQRLQRQREVHDMFELRVEAFGGKTYGGDDDNVGAVNGSKDFGIETVLYSPPIGEDWRVFAGAGYAEGDFQEGTGTHDFQRVGLERRTRDLTLEAEVSNHSYGFGSKQGGRLAFAYDINDYWQYGASLEYFAAATPLRALNSDITANGGSGFIRWRANESREWKFALSPSHFSDGNDRVEALLTGREGIYTAPDVQVDLGLEVGASHNSESDDVPYFNPKSDLSVLPMVSVNHLLYQRYETRWSQQFQVGAGTYTQKYHSTGGMALLGYGQRYSWNDVVEVGGMLSAINRPYDGERETDLRLMVDLTFRF